MVTLALVPMFAFLGLVTDLGYMQYVKMSAQSAAEAAARAAIISYHETVGGSNPQCGTGTGAVPCSATSPTTCPSNITTPANFIERGCMYAQSHGFNSTNQWVTYQSNVASVPPTAPGMGTATYWVTFRVIQKVPQMFSAVLGNTSGMVAARSTTAVIGASDCIYALNRTNYPGAVSVGGTSNLTSSCGVYVNSTNSCAISTNGNGAVLSAPEYDVVGNVCTQNPLTPAANTGVSQVSDPLAALPVPASAPYTCDHIGTYSPNSDTDLYPGVYCGGIHVPNATYTFHGPGTYILVGGGLSTQSANSHIASTGGVTFYNTFGATTNSSTYSYSGIQIGASSTVSLTAPTSGTYAGILFFDDRNSPVGTADNYGGGSTAVYQGVIYAKNAAVTMEGNSSVSTAYTMLVADTISLTGTSGFNNDYSSLLAGSPIQKTVMVE
jgi:hypothetical protein